MWIEPPDAHSARLWLEGISISLQLWPQPQVSTSELQWLRDVFEAADSNRSGVLERSDLRTLLNAANMAGDEREALEEALGSKRVVRGMRLVGQLNFAQATSRRRGYGRGGERAGRDTAHPFSTVRRLRSCC